jgi:hypothetical protein
MNDTGPGQAKVCAKCRRVLALYEDGDGNEEWIHGLQDSGDHTAQPVDQNELHAQYRCDFCTTDESAFILPVAEFALPGQPNNMSGDDWSACWECARRIETNQWTALFKRAVTMWERAHGERMAPEIKEALRKLHLMIRKNVKGALYPFVAPEVLSDSPLAGREKMEATEWGQNRAKGPQNL